MTGASVVIYKKELAASAEDHVKDKKSLRGKKIKSITISVTDIGFTFYLEESFREILGLMDGSESELTIDDFLELKAPDGSHFIFQSPLSWKMANDGASTASYVVFFDVEDS